MPRCIVCIINSLTWLHNYIMQILLKYCTSIWREGKQTPLVLGNYVKFTNFVINTHSMYPECTQVAQLKQTETVSLITVLTCYCSVLVLYILDFTIAQ